ncbi:hypothetical protein PaeBR_06890 [Paenibacillus sp. BR2-3]|uniref:hypothetical protein n=1 Tax=Paenibacillus sp. BR2-3 TaxID=3048494 RepID=UPI003977C983
MSAYATTVAPGVSMQKTNLKCSCGECASLTHKAKLGRIGNNLVTVYNVPVYVCMDCGDSFMTGSDSKDFAAKVKEAVILNMDSISF